jgi:hypothetical protein
VISDPELLDAIVDGLHDVLADAGEHIGIQPDGGQVTTPV